MAPELVQLLAAEGTTGGHVPPVDVVALVTLLVAAWSAGWVARRVGYPSVLGELLAGIVLGPPLLGWLSDGAGLDVLGELGVILMMLWIGTELDLNNLRKASRAGLYAAIGGFVVPFAGGLVVMRVFGFDWIAAIFVGAAVGVTSLATKSRILADLRLFDTRIAYVLLAGALLSDTATLVVFAGVLSFAGEGGNGVGATAGVLLQALVFFGVMGAAAAVAPRVGAWTQERLGADGPGWGLPVLVTVGLAGAVLAEVLGLHAILGSFLAGMVARRGLLSERTERESAHLLERLSIGILAPVFFTTAGFEIDLAAVFDNLALVAAVVGVATFGKILGTALAYMPTGHGWREGVVVGMAMNGRGAVEIIVAGIGVEQGLITPEVFTVLVVMAVLTTASVPVLLKLGVEWLRNRGELADAGGARRGIVIIGAGALARTWAQALHGHREVALIDRNRGRVRKARALGLTAVEGDVTDVDALADAGAGEAEIVLGLTGNFEVNLLAARLAREEFGIRELHVATGPEPHQSVAVLLQRYDCEPIGPSPLDVDRWSALLGTGEATTTTVVVGPRVDAEEIFERLTSGKAGLPVAVGRDDEVVPFTVVDGLRTGDRVTVVVRPADRAELGEPEPATLG